MEFWTGGGMLSRSRIAPGAFANGYEAYIGDAKTAEDLGFDAYGAPEHHFMYDGFVTIPLQVLAAAAAVTNRIKLRTGAMLQPLYDPLEAAEYGAALDVISNGRAMMGLGLGYRPYEFDGFGYEKRTRGARHVEAIQIINLATKQDTFSYTGKHYQYENARIYPTPVQRPIPVWHLGGTSVQAARRAGQNGFPYWLANSSFDRTKIMVEEYRRAGREAGWPQESLMVAAQKDICIGATVKDAEEQRQFLLDNFYDEHILGYGYLVDDEGKHVYGATREHPMYQRFVSSFFCGTVDMVIEELKRYEAIGMHAVSIGGDKELVSAKILPEFKRK